MPNNGSALPDAILPLSETERRNLSGPALRGFFRVAAAWHLSDRQQAEILGLKASTIVDAWRSSPPDDVGPDVLARMSYVIGIYKALRTLFADPVRANRWLHATNGAFNGRSAITLSCEEGLAGLQAVRRHVDAQLA